LGPLAILRGAFVAAVAVVAAAAETSSDSYLFVSVEFFFVSE
jgi:hypothetical protein